jgi:hypothetical protein
MNGEQTRIGQGERGMEKNVWEGDGEKTMRERVGEWKNVMILLGGGSDTRLPQAELHTPVLLRSTSSGTNVP